MESKYYTPTIEEFHVGFEYEYENRGSLYDKENWVKATGGIESQSPRERHIAEGKIRVKHLDREDIESLGWRYQEDSGKYVLETDVTYFWMEEFGKNSFVVDETFFIIKNKSELKKLMQQLRIS